MDLYTTSSMLAALPSLRKAPRFLQDVIFSNVVTSDREEVVFDTLNDDARLAPFVSPLVQGKPMTQRGFQTNQIKPAYLKPKFHLDPRAAIRRQAGEMIGGNLSAGDREKLILAQGLIDQRDMITRRIEVMCAAVLKTGAITISGDDYPTVVVDFDRDDALTVALAGGDKWGQVGVSAYDLVETWTGTLGQKCGAAPNIVLMGSEAWKLYKADPKTEKAIDATLGQTNQLNLGMTNGEPGTAIYKGSDGSSQFYVYNDTYTDDDGQTRTLFDTRSVTIVATGAAVGTQGYGCIIDAELSYPNAQMVPKSWLDHDPGRRNLMTQCAPIPFLGRINASFHATV